MSVMVAFGFSAVFLLMPLSFVVVRWYAYRKRKAESDRLEKYQTFNEERKQVRVRQQLELFYNSRKFRQKQANNELPV
jgi:cbb3-type cytochrome oxidase subunit 3